jgi:UPF0716 protein FxsA
MVRAQGRLAIGNLQRSFSELNDPTEPLAHGAMVLISGVLLLTPGFFTDGIGFALLIPAVRSAVFRYVRARFTVQNFSMGAEMHHGPQSQHPQNHSPHPTDETIIEGEFTEVDPSKKPTHKPSGWTKH